MRYSALRAALRIARRDAWQRKGHSALVIAMLALPIIAFSFIAAAYSTASLTNAERAERVLGGADLAIKIASSASVHQVPDRTNFEQAEPNRQTAPVRNAAELGALLPAGSRMVRNDSGPGTARTRTGIADVDLHTVDYTDPLAAGTITQLDGRAPQSVDEVAIAAPLAERVGITIGGAFTLIKPVQRTLRVVGLVEYPDDLRLDLVVGRPDLLFAADDGADHTTPEWTSEWLAATPTPVAWPDVVALNERGVVAVSRPVMLDPPPRSAVPLASGRGFMYEYYDHSTVKIRPERIILAAMGTAFGLLEVVLLAGAAFAVGARRRQRQLALIIATGGTPGHVRLVVLAGAVVLGAVAATIGTAVGLAAVPALRPLLEEQFFHRRLGELRIFPAAVGAIVAAALVTGLLAALVPAWTASRHPVVTALSGHRRTTRARRRYLVAGVITTVGGGALAAYGARVQSRGPQFDGLDLSDFLDENSLMLAGLIVAELGLVLCTPALVGAIAALGRGLPLGPRIALRDAARNRSAAAPAISAVMAAVVGSVAVGFIVASYDSKQLAKHHQDVPDNYVGVTYTGTPDRYPWMASAVQTLHAELPVSSVHAITTVDCPARERDTRVCSVTAEPPLSQRCPFLGPDGHLAHDYAEAAKDVRCRSLAWRRGGLGIRLPETIVDDGSAIGAITAAEPNDAAAAADTLRRAGAVVGDPRLVENGQITLAVRARWTESPVRRFTVPGYALTTGVAGTEHRVILSPDLLPRFTLQPQLSGLVAATTRLPTQAEQDRAKAAILQVNPTLDFAVEDRPAMGHHGYLTLLAIVAGLTALGAVAVATSLAAADGRADLSTFASVGASPRVRRILAMCRAGMISGVGALLGTVTGTGAAIAVITVLDRVALTHWPLEYTPTPIEPPWLTLVITVVAVPLLATLGAGLLTRSRLPIERRLT